MVILGAAVVPLGGMVLVLEVLVVLVAGVDAVDPLIDDDTAEVAVLLVVADDRAEVNVLLFVDDAVEANVLLALADERTVDNVLLAVPDDTAVVDVLFSFADDVTKAEVAVAFDGPLVLETALVAERAFVSVGRGPKGAGVGSVSVPFT